METDVFRTRTIDKIPTMYNTQMICSRKKN